MRRVIIGMSSAAVLTLALASTVLGAAFDNGGLETVNYTSSEDWGQLVDSGEHRITGWNVTEGNVDIVKGYWNAYGGTYSIDLNGRTQGAISQDLDTTTGKRYFVAFQMAGNPTDAPGAEYQCVPGEDKSLTVTVDGGQAQDFTFSTSGHSLSDIGWVPKGYTFTAQDGSTTLKFRSNNPQGACGPAIDSISVTQIVDTGEDCKNGGWKDLVDSALNHFRNQGDCVSYYATGERNLANPRA
jgi:choice-of-anchor C domain-containing protein